MSNENNNQFNNEARENHDGQFGHGQKRPYNRPKNYKYKPQHRNSYGRKPMQDRKAPADKEKNGIQVPFKAAIKNSSRRPKKPTSKLKIIPLGGLEQIGMNITAFEYEDSIVVVDCGLAFPEDDMLGIDLVIPDVTYLKENISKVKGFVITHGHEDHIGALPYVLKDVNVPVYSTKLTIALIANKLKEHNMTNTTKLKEVRHGQVINLGDFSIEFIKTNHSIQDASALAIYSPAGIVVHTGDFKVDYTPVFGDAIDLQRFAEIGKNFPRIFRRVLKGHDLEFNIGVQCLHSRPEIHQKLCGRHGGRADADDILILLHGVFCPSHGVPAILDDIFCILVHRAPSFCELQPPVATVEELHAEGFF